MNSITINIYKKKKKEKKMENEEKVNGIITNIKQILSQITADLKWKQDVKYCL